MPAPGECQSPAWPSVTTKGTVCDRAGSANHPYPEQPNQVSAAEESNLGFVRRNLVFPVSGEYLKSLGFAFHLGGEGGGGAKKKRIFNHLKTDTSNSTNTGLEHRQDNVIYALWPHCTKQVDGQGHGTSPCKLSLSINRKP